MTFAVSATEKDFIDPNNHVHLVSLEERMEAIRRLVGARQKTFAGILPSLFNTRGVMDGAKSMERRTTIAAVQLALVQVRQEHGLPENTPILVLGGRGFVGSGLMEVVAGQEHYYALDIGEQKRFFTLRECYGNKPLIVLNLTKKGALLEYTPHFWPGVVLVNEVYPEPGKVEVEELKARGVVCYHIVGVRAKAFPAFPRGYQGGIPCCASFLPEKEEEGSFQVIVRKM